MDYESTDDDEVVPPSGNIISIAVAILGIVLGTAGLYFGFNANKRLNSIDTSIQDNSTSKAEIEKAIGVLDARLAEQANQIQEQAKVINRLRVYLSQSEQAIKKLTSELNVNRQQINKMKTRPAQVKSVASNASESMSRTPESADRQLARAEAGRTYTIQSGDTLGGLATRFGVSLQSILDANPDANPRRLAIGQEITIPVR